MPLGPHCGHPLIVYLFRLCADDFWAAGDEGRQAGETVALECCPEVVHHLSETLLGYNRACEKVPLPAHAYLCVSELSQTLGGILTSVVAILVWLLFLCGSTSQLQTGARALRKI